MVMPKHLVADFCRLVGKAKDALGDAAAKSEQGLDLLAVSADVHLALEIVDSLMETVVAAEEKP
jgi:hypothetical protein